MDKPVRRQPVEENTNLFDGNRNGDVVPPDNDNFSEARMPKGRTQRHCDKHSSSDGIENSPENAAFRAGYKAAFLDGFNEGQRQVRMGSGQGSYCPEFNSFANSRQAFQEEAMLNQGDNWEMQRPIPQCRHRHQGQRQSDWGDIQAVSSGDFEYARPHRNGGGKVLDFFRDLAYGIGDVAQGLAPAIGLYAQVEMARQGRVGGHYFGSYADNSYYNPRPVNPWNNRRNIDLISYNNNSGFYDNYNYGNNGSYMPMWMNG